METTLLANALRLPPEDVEALTQGRTITALPWAFLTPGQSFGLFPDCRETEKIRFWASCEACKSIEDVDSLDILAKSTQWEKAVLEQQLADRGFLLLAYLRVYEMAEPISIVYKENGEFLALKEPKMLSKPLPVISDDSFAQRRNHLDNCELPLHLDLEKLQHQIGQMSRANSAAKAFDQTLQVFLGWGKSRNVTSSIEPWVKEITLSGNSSDGDLFEKRVRQAFVYLGFTNTLNDPKKSLDPEASGGAGGIDFYCEAPYPIVGECKASKLLKVNDNKDGAPFQLIKLGQKYLQQEGFNSAIKIIMAPGELTKDANLTAIGNQMNIMRPETLQRLIEIKSAHPGAVDLLKLEPCLRNAPFGTDADAKINEFIDGILQEIRIRAHAISTFKAYLEKTKVSEAGIEKFSGFFCGSDAPQHLEDRELYDILIELSSPLAGYLGRVKGDNWKADRFYFLRELQLN
jgi:hypothetical protein